MIKLDWKCIEKILKNFTLVHITTNKKEFCKRVLIVLFNITVSGLDLRKYARWNWVFILTKFAVKQTNTNSIKNNVDCCLSRWQH